MLLSKMQSNIVTLNCLITEKHFYLNLLVTNCTTSLNASYLEMDGCCSLG